MMDTDTIEQHFGEMPCNPSVSGTPLQVDKLFVFWIGNLLMQIQWISMVELRRLIWGGPWTVKVGEASGGTGVGIE